MRHLTIPLLPALLCAGLTSAAVAERLPCELRAAVPEWQAYDCIPADADTDGVDELFYADDGMVSMRNQDLTYVWQRQSFIPRGAYRCHLFASDLNGDSVPETIATISVPELLSVFVNGRRTLVDSRPRPPGWSKGWDADMPKATFADLNEDGVKDLVLDVCSGYSWPWAERGVYAIDPTSGRRLWRFGLGPQVSDLELADLDRDGHDEVLISTFAPGNGCSENGTDDSHTYVICLGRFGQMLWRTTVRSDCYGAGADVKVADLDRDGVLDVIAVDNSCVSGRMAGRILLLNSNDGSILRQVAVDSIQQHFVVDGLNADGEVELVTSTFGGSIVVRDKSLESVQTRFLPEGIERIAACDHLLGTGQKQLVVVTRAGGILVLDHRLRTLASYSQLRQIRGVRPVRTGEGRPMGLLVSTSPYERSSTQDNWMLLQLVILHRPFPWAAVSAGLAVLLAFAGIGLVFIRRQHRREMRGMARGLVQRAGVVELDRKGRVLAANDYARVLLGLVGDWERQDLLTFLTAPEFEPLRQMLGSLLAGKEKRAACEVVLPYDGAARTYRAVVSRVRFGGFFLSLEDLSAAEYARRVGAWGPVAQRLAHGIKSPLSTIKLTAQQVEESGHAAEAQVIKEEADRLSKMADGFMRLANFEPLKLEPRDLDKLVERVVEERGIRLRPDIELKLELQPGLPSVNLDEEQMARALANLVDNAVTAMNGRGGLTIQTRLSDDGRQVVVEVSDTGPGIPEEYRAKLFQPFFTRKPGGTGLGLTIVKKTAEDHGGAVEVESEVGKGTTFRIVLPAPEAMAPRKSQGQNPNDKGQP
jgi:signal transduction histidine kinase